MSAPQNTRSPLAAVLDVRRGEWALAAKMFGYFFLVITTFWILKPIKKGVFIRYHRETPLDLFGVTFDAPQAELIAKVANMGVAFVAVVVFSAIAKRVQREKLTLVFCVFFAITLVLYALSISSLGGPLVWSFYLYGDLYSTIMVATFFAFLNDVVTPDAAKRLYGLIVLGGVLGGAFGTSVLNAWIRSLETPYWIWICLGITGVVAVLAWSAGRHASDTVHAPAGGAADAAVPEPVHDDNPAVAGAKLVFRSGYLLSIVALVGLYEIVSTILDFQFTAAVNHYVPGDAIDAHLAMVYNITNVGSLVVQLFVSTFVMSRFPLKVSLLITPIVIVSASAAFLMMPLLWVGSFLNTADGSFSYSINQSAREALYTPTTRDEKYKAKAFIDMFVQRFAKALAVGVSLGITMVFDDFGSVRWLSLVVVLVVVVWILAARYGGKRFAALSHERRTP